MYAVIKGRSDPTKIEKKKKLSVEFQWDFNSYCILFYII